MERVKIIVTVPNDLARFADELGRRIDRSRRGQAGAVQQNNLRVTPEESERLNVLGKRGEAALYYAFGEKTAGAIWDTSISTGSTRDSWDIKFRGIEYDAKAIEKDDEHSLIVIPGKVAERRRYVLVGIQFWPQAAFIGWCTGADVLTTEIKDKKGGRPAYFIEQNDPMLRSPAELPFARGRIKVIESGYILEYEGEYVERVEPTEWQTVTIYFAFTKDRRKAKVFSYQELYWKQATNPVGISFMMGFSRGRAIPVSSFPMQSGK